MRLPAGISKLGKNEDGMSVISAIILLLIIAVFVVITLDTISVYSTWQSVSTVTTDAARLAAQEYNETRIEARITVAAGDYCNANGLTFVSTRKNPPVGHNFEITCAKSADTIVFKSLPVLKELIYQEATKDTSENQ